MQDEPTPAELAKAVTDFLRSDIIPLISGHEAFKLRVGINALDLIVRQLAKAGQDEVMELERLKALLGSDGSLFELNRSLAGKIATGAIDLSTLGLKEHLWQTTLDKLAVDQPNYASYKRETERENG
ncbi:DUF6285 domain-containing protein [Bradyrhizobium sp. SZCCHNR2026]|uniref:DUF6285 domain-containing protein n=1 Tax=Bradyrhizobium sp. SZCCHNR2026 TaxID=3057381 RepID=UPI002916D10C|nr:DUF6285 domain-containing protein [Bradyrhizobium sp. SZCCHNR2026]